MTLQLSLANVGKTEHDSGGGDDGSDEESTGQGAWGRTSPLPEHFLQAPGTVLKLPHHP